jgi:hypothetical protein
MRKWILWIPVLMVGSLVYWTIALNFGGLSLIALSSFSVDPDGADGQALPVVKDGFQPITVNLSDTSDEAPGAGAADDSASVTVDVVSDHDPGRGSDDRAAGDRGAGDRGAGSRADQGPGDTAF